MKIFVEWRLQLMMMKWEWRRCKKKQLKLTAVDVYYNTQFEFENTQSDIEIYLGL